MACEAARGGAHFHRTPACATAARFNSQSGSLDPPTRQSLRRSARESRSMLPVSGALPKNTLPAFNREAACHHRSVSSPLRERVAHFGEADIDDIAQLALRIV